MSNKPKIPACIIIDEEDREYFEQWQWHVGNGYCTRGQWDSVTKKTRTIHMHRLILERKLGRPIASGMVCDHIDGNRANGSRANLREVTVHQNNMNNNKARGYGWNKAANKWMAYIKVNGKSINLGYYDLEADARAAYLAAKAKYHVIP